MQRYNQLIYKQSYGIASLDYPKIPDTQATNSERGDGSGLGPDDQRKRLYNSRIIRARCKLKDQKGKQNNNNRFVIIYAAFMPSMTMSEQTT